MKYSTKITLSTVLLLILNGCNGVSPTPDEKIKVDKTLPVVSLTKNGVITDMNSVAFEYKTIKDPRVKGIYVYKRDPKDENQQVLKYYDTIKNRYKTHYVDNNVQPDTQYTYAFRAFSDDAQANQSLSYDLHTLPVLNSVVWVHSISGMPRSAKIIWRPHLNPRVAWYIIERKTLDEKDWERLAVLKGRLNAEYIDEDLDDDKVYMYRIKVKTFDNIVSKPSQVVRVVTKPLPNSVTNIQASKDLPKKIKITWRDTTQKDFSRYYLYRSDTIDGSYKLIAKLYNNSYIDDIDADGKAYFYRVSVVDKDGLESESETTTVMGKTLSKPEAPTLLEAKLLSNAIEIEWENSDQRVQSYIVERHYKTSWFKENIQEFKGIKGLKFIDRNIKPDSTYTYIVYGVDKYGIISKPSVAVRLNTPESEELLHPKPKKSKLEQVQHKSVPVQKEEVLEPIENLDINEI